MGMSQILEVFLETGVDSDCYILMRDRQDRITGASTKESGDKISEDRESEGDSISDKVSQRQITERPHKDRWIPEHKWMRVDSQRRRSEAAYVVSLRDFIRQAKPANYEHLEQLLSEENRTQEVSTTNLREIEAELATSQHPEFKSPKVRSVGDLDDLFAEESIEKLIVYWIKWKDATIPGFLNLRLY